MPVTSCHDHHRLVMAVHARSSAGVWKPDPNAASVMMYGHAWLPPGGMGEGAEARTPIATADRFTAGLAVTVADALAVVTFHDTDSTESHA